MTTNVTPYSRMKGYSVNTDKVDKQEQEGKVCDAHYIYDGMTEEEKDSAIKIFSESQSFNRISVIMSSVSAA
jgi:hypothetical protein